MRFVRLELNGEPVRGRLEDGGDAIVVDSAPCMKYSTDKVRFLAPVQPSKIVAIGLNYRDHADEVKLPVPGEPILFIKPATRVIGPGEAIVLPPQSRRVDSRRNSLWSSGRQRKTCRKRQSESMSLATQASTT